MRCNTAPGATCEGGEGANGTICQWCGKDMFWGLMREMDKALAGPPSTAQMMIDLEREVYYATLPPDLPLRGSWEPRPIEILPSPFTDYARAWEKVRHDYLDSLPKYVSHHVQEIDS